MRTIDADALVAQWEADAKQVEDVIAKMFIYGAIHDVKHAPTIETEQQWIPCSERLPEENEVVLTQARFSDDIKMAVSARIDYNYWTGWGTREVNVVAWMPLPPVYQEEDNK